MAQHVFTPLPVKAVAEKKDYSFDWSRELDRDGDTISGSGSAWSIEAGVTINTTTNPATNDTKTTTVWLDPGSTVGEYNLKNTITTTRGRVHVATASLTVVA